MRVRVAGLLRLAFFGGVMALAVPSTSLAASPSILDPASPNAEDVAGLLRIIFWLSVIVFLAVEGMIIYAIVRFRRRRDDEMPDQIHGHTGVEIAWTVTPAIIVIVLTVLSQQSLVRGYSVPADAMEVTAVGKQWWWEFRYSEPEILTATELVVPVGRPVVVRLESTDVIHSFWVPQLAGKQDAIPGDRQGGHGRNSVWFTALRPGRYEGQCAEFCGTQHAGMRFSVVAMDEVEYAAWVQATVAPAPVPPPGSAEERGMELVSQRGCQGCHAIDGVDAMVGRIGPNLTHLMQRRMLAGGTIENTPENLARWISAPGELKAGALMPSMGLSPDEVADVVAYLRTLE